MSTRLAVLAALAGLALHPVVGGAQEKVGTEVGGGIYLFHYQPVNLDGHDPKTEVYAAFARVRHRTGPWELYVEARARDDKLRPFFRGTAWFQEAWAAYHAIRPGAGATLTLRAGKTYQTTGRFWDGSFFGNLHYFDGLKLNPQFLVEASGRVDAGAAELGWAAQWILDSDRVSGALDGRDFETQAGIGDRHGFSGRVTATLGDALTVGGTLFSRGIRLDQGATSDEGESWRALHGAVDVELRTGPVVAYAEWLRRGDAELPPGLADSIAGTDATYWLWGLQWHRGRFHARYNVSRADYQRLDRISWIHQPGVTWDFSDHLSGLLEVDHWTTEEDGGGGADTVDQSLSFVLLLTF